jgi:hypothetical protein
LGGTGTPEKIRRREFLSFLGWTVGAAAVSFFLGSALGPKPAPLTVTTTLRTTETTTTTVERIPLCPKVLVFPDVVSFKKDSENLIQLEFLNFDPSIFPNTTRAYASMNGIVVEYYDKNKEMVQVRTFRKPDPQRIIYYFDKQVFVGHVNAGPVYLEVSVPQAGFEQIVKITIKDKPMQTVVGSDVLITSSGVPIVFSRIRHAGTTTVRLSDSGPGPPEGVTALPPFYNISTTAQYSGPIYVALPFDEDHFPRGTIPRVLHYNENKGVWEDSTHSIDFGDKLVCGRVWDLSTFVLTTSA